MHGQPRAIEGSVRNAGGRALPSAMIVSADSIFFADSLGRFQLPALKEKHFIKVIAPGLAPKNIVLPFNFQERLLIYLDSIAGTTDFNPYEIIRRARLKKHENAQYYTSYEARVFKTASAAIARVPFNLWPVSGLLLPAKKDTGAVYFSEQRSLQKYYGPHNHTDSVIHFQAAGTLPMPDFIYQSDKSLSFYQDRLYLPEVGAGHYYSPLADRAFQVYDFVPLGSYTDEGMTVYRIGFAPKKYGTPAPRGYLDIYDSTFTIAYANFLLGPSAHLEKLDSVRVEQLYYYRDNRYHRAFQKMDFHLNINGFRGEYLSSVYFLKQNYIAKDSIPQAKGEVFFIDSTSITGDETYWENHRARPIDSQQKHLLETESLNAVFKQRYSRALYLSQPFRPLKLLYNSYIYKADDYYFFLNPLYYALGYNTVEGFYLRYDLPIHIYGQDHEWLLKPEVRYGFADAGFKSRMLAELTYDLGNPKKVTLEVGHVLDQFNEQNPISPLINSAYTLFFSRNYLKLYGKDYIKAHYQLELINGLEMQSSLEFASRFPVYNNASFTITGNPEKFTPNNPVADEDIDSNGFPDHQALTFGAQLAYQFHQQYKTINGKKINLKMNTPRLYINYRQGINTSISQTRYSFLAGGITFNTLMGKAGYTRWDLSGGGFFDVQNIAFIDYKHFNGTQTFYLQPTAYYYHPIKQFSTLGYYDYSTRNAFVEGHVEHHFNGYLLSKIGFLRKTQIHAYTGVNYLHNFTKQQFLEFFVGIDNIHNIMRVEIAGGLDNFTNLTPTLLVGIDFDLLYYVKNHKK